MKKVAMAEEQQHAKMCLSYTLHPSGFDKGKKTRQNM